MCVHETPEKTSPTPPARLVMCVYILIFLRCMRVCTTRFGSNHVCVCRCTVLYVSVCVSRRVRIHISPGQHAASTEATEPSASLTVNGRRRRHRRGQNARNF